MKILPITANNNFYQTKANKKSPNFTGISKELPKKFIETGSFGGDQGDYQLYEVTIEYHPYSDESASEIAENMKKLERPSESYWPPAYTYPGSYTVYPDAEFTDYKVVLGKRLKCTTNEADLVIKEYLKNAKK